MKVMLDEGAYMPTKAHEDDAGFDLYAPHDFNIEGNSHVRNYYLHNFALTSATVDTGVHIAIPKGYVGMIKSKSGLNVKGGLPAEGGIDCGYTGSIVINMYNHSQ